MNLSHSFAPSVNRNFPSSYQAHCSLVDQASYRSGELVVILVIDVSTFLSLQQRHVPWPSLVAARVMSGKSTRPRSANAALGGSRIRSPTIAATRLLGNPPP